MTTPTHNVSSSNLNSFQLKAIDVDLSKATINWLRYNKEQKLIRGGQKIESRTVNHQLFDRTSITTSSYFNADTHKKDTLVAPIKIAFKETIEKYMTGQRPVIGHVKITQITVPSDATRGLFGGNAVMRGSFELVDQNTSSVIATHPNVIARGNLDLGILSTVAIGTPPTGLIKEPNEGVQYYAVAGVYAREIRNWLLSGGSKQ